MLDDEDKMILKLQEHKAIKNALIARLRQEGISCKATTDNNPKGDVLIIKKKDAARVQAIIRSLAD